MTSTNLMRGVLGILVRIRGEDEVVIEVHRGTEGARVFQSWLAELTTRNWKVTVNSRRRRVANLLGVLGWSRYREVTQSGDLYLNLESDYLGPRARPALYTVHDLAALRDRKLSSMPWHGARIKRVAMELVARSGQPIVAVSEFTKQDLIAFDHRFAGRVHVVPNGVESLWHAAGRRDDPVGAESANSRKPYWIWWGHITRRKNVDGLLRAYARLLSDGCSRPSIPGLVLVGSLGHDMRSLPGLIRQLGLDASVEFVPHQRLENLVALVKRSVGLLFPSWYEGFGMPVVEAFALGKPVMTANGTSLPEVAGGLGILVDPNDTTGMVKAMLRTLDADQTSTDLCHRRMAWASRFTFENAAKGLSQVIDSVASKRLNG